MGACLERSSTNVPSRFSELATENSKDSPGQKNLIEIIARNGMHITPDKNDVDLGDPTQKRQYKTVKKPPILRCSPVSH